LACTFVRRVVRSLAMEINTERVSDLLVELGIRAALVAAVWLILRAN